MNHKQYLGDGVYVHFDGEYVVLTTEDGYRTTNTIFLEPEVLGHFLIWWRKSFAAAPPK